MQLSLHDACRIVISLILVGAGATGATADKQEWIDLSTGKNFEAWRKPTGEWFVAGAVGLDPKNPKRLAAKPGNGILVNGRAGRTDNLISKEKFGDLEVQLEFLIPKGSNSGVKFEGLYEIQILDSWGVKNPTASDCGGIYPRAELEPTYHLIDKGVPPRLNAARHAGEWQALKAIFQAPRFDAGGKKIANARFVRVTLNGQVIHENVEVKTPTGHAWREKEIPSGPLLLQADHGPIAFRNIRVRPFAAPAKQP
jgi:hypothetical protein